MINWHNVLEVLAQLQITHRHLDVELMVHIEEVGNHVCVIEASPKDVKPTSTNDSFNVWIGNASYGGHKKLISQFSRTKPMKRTEFYGHKFIMIFGSTDLNILLTNNISLINDMARTFFHKQNLDIESLIKNGKK